tara:strand:- start:4258 stop:8745 length:4488 start_codon:yes stop_codon:yes gene_type:complete
MEGHVNTYGGMDKDSAYDSIKQNMYIDALDIRISTDKGESQGAFTNMKGNKEVFTIPTSGTFDNDPPNPPTNWSALTPEIIGYGTIRNSIILFVADDSGTKGWIYEVKYDPATREILATYPKLLYYSDNLFFKKEWPIEALGRYENSSTQKIYWTDYNNFFRTINIADSNLNTFPVENIDIFPALEYTQPILTQVSSGGVLNTGMYQIAYRLITSDGKETLISPPSNMIQITTASEYNNIVSYTGDPEKLNTGKSIVIQVDTSTYLENFREIEFFSLYYESPIATPIATFIEKVEIVDNLTELTYQGNETETFDIELFTFTTKNFAFKTFKTVTQKDNYLIGANIKSSTISVEDLLNGGTFDAKTRRYNNDATPDTPFTPGNPINDLNNAFNAEFNKDKHWDVTWQSDTNQYKYQSNGATLGGEGPNISYTFHLERMTEDAETNQAGYHNIFTLNPLFGDSHDLNDGYGTRPNPSYQNNSSPHISGLLRGYKRGETYRFGIVFYTKKGEATYVEYIGDIKFPDISERDNANNSSATPYWPLSTMAKQVNGDFSTGIMTAFNLGIKFNLDFTSCPELLDQIESYQIVRVPRTNNDKRRLCQGIINPLAFQSIGTGTPPNDFDFKIDGSDNVVHQSNTNIGYITPVTSLDRLEMDSLDYWADYQDPDLNPGVGVSFPNIPIMVKSTYRVITRAQHISFYSPEVSYASDESVGTTIPDIIANPGNNACLLMTGTYSFQQNKATNPTDFDYLEDQSNAGGPNATNLGPDVNQLVDVRQKLYRTLPITFNSVENIKKFKSAHYFDMRDSTNVTIDTKTTRFGTAMNGGTLPADVPWLSPLGGSENIMVDSDSYMRNYIAAKGQNQTLNDPDSARAVLGRAGSNISGLLDTFYNDPLNPSTIYTPGTESSVRDYFLVNKTNTGLLFDDPAFIQIPNNSYIDVLDKNGNTGTGYNFNRALPLGDVVIPRNEIYGGTTLSVLESNTWIAASPVIDKTELNPIVFGGDIFIGIHHIQKSMLEFNANFYNNGSTNGTYAYPFTNTQLLVTESTINTNIDHGANTSTEVKFTYTGTGPAQEDSYYRQEDNNSFSTHGIKKPGEDYYRFYAYNNVFSKENREVLFFVKPNLFVDASLTNDIRAYLSNVKTNGETIDSWTKFAINDFYDIDDHGPINKIINFKDNVYFIQDEGIGVYSINREAITTTDDGVPTELGTAKGWGKHQYYSKEIGSIHQWAVAATNNAIYFFDAIHRKIYQIGQGKAGMTTSPLSELKGMHSYLQNLGEDVFIRKEDGGDNPIKFKGAHIGIDEINDEVIFTFLSVTARGIIESIVFDELANQFSTRLSITPKMWINNGDTLITPNYNTGNENDIYVHNIGNWGEFYGVQKECQLTLVINPKADINKVLRFLEFNSIVRDDNKNIDREKTITGFKITTEYQSSDIIYESVPESLTRIKRRFDKWRIKLPRDKDSRGRFRSTHFLLTLYFDNTYNKELIMNRLVSYYDPQIF